MSKKLVIVYQMGKVGSTSIVHALSKYPDFEVHQAHFLSPKTFRDSIEHLLNENTSDYIFHHQRGQTFSNIGLYRRLFKALNGHRDAESITIISGRRKELDWTRSALIQDFPEYKVVFQEITNLLEIGHSMTDRESTEFGFYKTIDLVIALRAAGIAWDEFGRLHFKKIPKGIDIHSWELFQKYKRILNLFSRPYHWFSEQFESLFDLNLNDYENQNGGVIFIEKNNLSIMIYNYDKLNEEFHQITRYLGLEGEVNLPVSNVSEDKEGANLVFCGFDRLSGL